MRRIKTRMRAILLAGGILALSATQTGYTAHYEPSEPMVLEDEIYQPALYPAIEYTGEELAMVAKLIYGESNYCTDRHQQLVGAVVKNRVLDSRFPDTIKDVILQKDQYSPAYARNLPDEATADAEIKRCFVNARAALEGRVPCDSDVVWQAEFVQGREVYEMIRSHIYTVTYFCK